MKKLAKLILCLLLAGCGKTDYPETLTGSNHEWHRIKSGNLVVYVTDKGTDLNIEQIDQVAGEVALKFPSDSGSGTSGIFEILIADNGIIKDLGMNNATGAGYNGDVIALDINRLSEPSILNTLRHEMVHAATTGRSRCETPGWFDEGIAQYYQFDINNTRIAPMYKAILDDAAKSGKIIDFEDLNRSSGEWRVDRKAAYSQSVTMYHYLISEFREEEINELFYEGGDFYTNLNRITGIDFETLVAGWRESLSL